MDISVQNKQTKSARDCGAIARQLLLSVVARQESTECAAGDRSAGQDGGHDGPRRGGDHQAAPPSLLTDRPWSVVKYILPLRVSAHSMANLTFHRNGFRPLMLVGDYSDCSRSGGSTATSARPSPSCSTPNRSGQARLGYKQDCFCKTSLQILKAAP